jgi:hypothetical protein
MSRKFRDLFRFSGATTDPALAFSARPRATQQHREVEDTGEFTGAPPVIPGTGAANRPATFCDILEGRTPCDLYAVNGACSPEHKSSLSGSQRHARHDLDLQLDLRRQAVSTSLWTSGAAGQELARL